MANVMHQTGRRIARPVAVSRSSRTDDLLLEVPSIRQRAGYLLTNPWRNYLLPAAFLKWLMTRSKSPLLAETCIRAGGWRTMEIMYGNDKPVDWLDAQALRDNPISMASRNRRRIITGLLAKLIARHGNKFGSHSSVNILGVGAGPGRHVQSAIIESGVELARVNAYLIDRDSDAFQYGKSLAAGYGIAERVQFLQGDALSIRETLPGVSMQVVKLVGLVEYLTDAQFVELLTAVRGVMTPGANLITHGLVDAHGTGRFLARVFDLKHNERTAAQVEALLESAGFHVTESMIEPVNVYPILVATV